MILTSNLGHKLEVGNDYPTIKGEIVENAKDQGNNNLLKLGPSPHYFEAEIPKGAQVVSLAGVYD